MRKTVADCDTLLEWALAYLLGEKKLQPQSLPVLTTFEPTPVFAGGNACPIWTCSTKHISQFEENWGSRAAQQSTSSSTSAANPRHLDACLMRPRHPGCPYPLECTPAPPPAMGLIAALEELENITTEEELQDAVSASWALIAAGKVGARDSSRDVPMKGGTLMTRRNPLPMSATTRKG